MQDLVALPKQTESDYAKPQTKRRHSLDHNPDELSSMTLQQLQSEPFDSAGPYAKPPPPSLGLDDASIASQLEEELLSRAARSSSGKKDTELLSEFFNSLDLESFNQCGEVITRKFAGVVAEMRDIRRRKREIALRIERDIASHEQTVQNDRDVVEERLASLRQSGENMVNVKTTG